LGILWSRRIKRAAPTAKTAATTTPISNHLRRDGRMADGQGGGGNGGGGGKPDSGSREGLRVLAIVVNLQGRWSCTPRCADLVISNRAEGPASRRPLT
jgi:hypothetical protein